MILSKSQNLTLLNVIQHFGQQHEDQEQEVDEDGHIFTYPAILEKEEITQPQPIFKEVNPIAG